MLVMHFLSFDYKLRNSKLSRRCFMCSFRLKFSCLLKLISSSTSFRAFMSFRDGRAFLRTPPSCSARFPQGRKQEHAARLTADRWHGSTRCAVRLLVRLPCAKLGGKQVQWP